MMSSSSTTQPRGASKGPTCGEGCFAGVLSRGAPCHASVSRVVQQQPRRSVVLRAAASQQEAAAAAAADEEDLWQFADRENWYLPKFAADNAPDWLPARFVSSALLGPGFKEVVLEVEISRERVPLRNAYRHVGQRAMVRVNSGEDRQLAVACAPFPLSMNKEALFRVRGDIYAGETKTVREEVSSMARLTLLVREGEAPEVWGMAEDDLVELGAFQGTGMDLRGPIIGIYTYPTIVIFCEGLGIAAARALIEARPEVGGLNFGLRTDVRMYYRAPNEALLLYRELFGEWQEKYSVQVITSTRDTFTDMFDNDDTLMYDPATTAAVVVTGMEEEAEEAALEACKEAEISVIVRQSVEQPETLYIMKGKEEA